MPSRAPIEYRDASPQVSAVFDDIKRTRQVAERQQFLETSRSLSGGAGTHLGQP